MGGAGAGANHLSGDELGVEAVSFHQLVVAALFDFAATVEDYQLVGVSDCGEPVSDDDCASAGHQAVEGLTHLVLADGVEVGGGFVENEDWERS